jgi:archaeosine synthase beta-subunit
VTPGTPELYPPTAAARDRFVLQHRGPRPSHHPWRHQGVIVEDERTARGDAARTATVLLTGRECPWRCAMCDLWTYTTVEDTPAGAIPAQIMAARAGLFAEAVPVTAMKLYNAGSFFDPRAVPEADYEAVAAALCGVSRVIVESHPALVGPRVDALIAALARHPGSGGPAALEVAMGLETAHPDALDRLNKRFTLEQFADAARALSARGASLRVFLLVSPPFVAPHEQDDWLIRSIDAAFACGASVISLVPTRSGNGTLDALGAGEFVQPGLEDVERSLALALAHARDRGRVFADLWDLERFARCPHCLPARAARMRQMNLSQTIAASTACDACGHRD